jgi:D-lyxose ketol-isomerase
MKRSEINKVLKEMEEFINLHKFALPPFCHFTPEEWNKKGHEYDEIRDNMLGWDITDYGLGDFNKTGFSLITIRNGNLALQDKYKKPYAEKLLYLRQEQYSPMHFHWSKMEDIINRGGGNVLIRVYNSTPEEGLDKTGDVCVCMDGRAFSVPAGTQVKLTPGESISIQPYMYHDFSVEEGTGPVLLGEVSQCNDDNTDNRFLESIGRFPEIEEDEPPYRLLCNEYPAVLQHA